MKSIIYELSSPYTLIQKEVNLDENRLAPNAVLAKTKYSVVSTGTELAAWMGKPALRPSTIYPRLIGYCNLASVVNVGELIKDILPGDHILTHQAHRSAFICDRSQILLRINQTEESIIKKLASTYLYHLGYSALLAGNYKPGHHVAIIGMGLIGMATASLVKIFGVQPLIFTNQEIKDTFYHIFKKKSLNFNVIQQLCDMDGVDIVINTSDQWSDHLLSLQLVRKGGEIICIGFPGRSEKKVEFNPLDSQYFYDKQITIKQCGYVTDLDITPIDKRFTLKRNMKYLASLILNGSIDPLVLLNIESSWTALGEVYQLLASRKKNYYSALIDWKE